MKDYNEKGYGKLELNMAVIPETDTSSGEIVYDPVKSKVTSLLETKQEAVDALDSVFFSYARILTESPYHVIRNALEDMAEYIRNLEIKPNYKSNYRNDYKKKNWEGNNQRHKKNWNKEKRSAKKRRNYFDDSDSNDFF